MIGQVVLDSLMGSWIICVVAKRLKREWIGIEKRINILI
jgi:DNA modification methylase